MRLRAPSASRRSGPASTAARAEGFRDYFRHLTEVEPKRAAQFGIRHYSWLCINAKEAENVALSREVIAHDPGVPRRSRTCSASARSASTRTPRNEATIFQEHLDLAMKTNELILIHTPHLEDKYKGTRMIVDMLKGDRRVKPQRVCIDHVEEHTVRLALDNGFWCGMTLYPTTKCTPARAADIIEMVGTERIMANSAGDWGKSDPLAVPELIQEMRRRGHTEADDPQGGVRQPAGVLAAGEQLAGVAAGTKRQRASGRRDREGRVLITLGNDNAYRHALAGCHHSA